MFFSCFVFGKVLCVTCRLRLLKRFPRISGRFDNEYIHLYGCICYVFCLTTNVSSSCAQQPPPPTPPRHFFPTSSRTFSLFPSAPSWLGTVFGFLLNRTPCLLLLLSNQSLPAVFSLFPPVLGIFPASWLTALWPTLLPMREAQRLPDVRPHSSQPGWSLADVFLTPGLLLSVPPTGVMCL